MLKNEASIPENLFPECLPQVWQRPPVHVHLADYLPLAQSPCPRTTGSGGCMAAVWGFKLQLKT